MSHGNELISERDNLNATDAAASPMLKMVLTAFVIAAAYIIFQGLFATSSID